MTDVASLAGVSHMTVSRVINDAGSVTSETRAKVLAAIRELDYTPNYAARTLVTGRSKTLGVVALDSTLYGPASMLYGIGNAARESEYAVSIVSLRVQNRTSIGEAMERLRAQGVEGIIVIAPHVAALRALQYIPHHVPVIAAQGGAGGPVQGVAADQRAGARLAVEHLLGLGHATVRHIGGPIGWFEGRERERGWRETLEHAGAERGPVMNGDWSPNSGYALGREMVKDKALTAVFVANDQMALGVLRAFSEAGIRVPEDVSVVGFDDTPESAFFSPPLTTIRQDFIELGRRTVKLLLGSIDGTGPTSLPSVTPELIVRDSAAPDGSTEPTRPAGSARRGR